MNSQKKYPLSLDGDTFNAFKQDFNQMLRQLLSEMEKRESEEATISMKMTVSLTKDQERDFEVAAYEAMKDITKPTFKHEISTVMQVKNKKTGSMGGTMKLVWDRDLCQYVMQEIDNGQTSLFDNEVVAEEEEEKDPGLGDFVVMGGELPPAKPGLPPPELDEVFERLKQLIGQELKVVEAMGNYTVRTMDNVVVFSSGFSKTSPVYVSEERLKAHVGHAVFLGGYNADLDEYVRGDADGIARIDLRCGTCGAFICSIDAPNQSKPDGYEYDDPEEPGDE